MDTHPLDLCYQLDNDSAADAQKALAQGLAVLIQNYSVPYRWMDVFEDTIVPDSSWYAAKELLPCMCMHCAACRSMDFGIHTRIYTCCLSLPSSAVQLPGQACRGT